MVCRCRLPHPHRGPFGFVCQLLQLHSARIVTVADSLTLSSSSRTNDNNESDESEKSAEEDPDCVVPDEGEERDDDVYAYYEWYGALVARSYVVRCHI